MTRSSRPTATAAQLTLLREGEATVQVARPYTPFPADLQQVWRRRDERPTFIARLRVTQAVRVSYRVWSDPLMLADLAARSLSNKSGEAIRGYAVARAGQVALNMTDRRFIVLAQAAANTAGRRAVEGPVSCRVKLLGTVEKYTPPCRLCGQLLEAHERVEEAALGDWGEATDEGWSVPTRRWDADKPRQDVRYYCPEAAS